MKVGPSWGGCWILAAGAGGATGGGIFRAGVAACTGDCGSARDDAGMLCCEIAACPRLPRVDAPLLGCARLGGGEESSLSSLGIGLVRRLLRSLLPIVSILSLLMVCGFAKRMGVRMLLRGFL